MTSTPYWQPDTSQSLSTKIPVGISQCLMGEKVRYNGEHKRSAFCTDVLSQYFEFKSFCPEVGAGMSIPRQPIRLVQIDDHIKVRGVSDYELDVTQDLNDYSTRTQSQLTELCGYILMQKSPSCGMERVTVYHPNGQSLHHKGVGVFAEHLMRENPLLPVEEAGRLNDSVLRENFITRVYAYHRWLNIKDHLTPQALIDFYSDYKYRVMAHDPQAYHSIGRLLSDLKGEDLQAKGTAFIELLMDTLKHPSNRKKNTNVLMHIQGYFKKQLNSDEKQELSRVIEQYRLGHVPLIAPLILLKHYLRKHPNEYLSRQAFLNPYPDELSLRNAL